MGHLESITSIKQSQLKKKKLGFTPQGRTEFFLGKSTWSRSFRNAIRRYFRAHGFHHGELGDRLVLGTSNLDLSMSAWEQD